MDNFAKFILSLKNIKEISLIFKGLFSPNEIENMTNRFKILEFLLKNYKYNEIQRMTGNSSATIAKISKELKKSDNFNKIVSRILLKKR